MTRILSRLMPGMLLVLGCVAGSAAASGPQGTPIVIGMIHGDRGADALAAARAAVELVNTERGGIAGRPVKLEACRMDGSPESSSDCAQKMVGMNVVAVTYAVDGGGEASVGVFERAGIPVVGVAPTSTATLKATNAFVFNAGPGGSYAAMSAFAARNLGTRKPAILAGTSGAAMADARAFGQNLLKAFGVYDVALIPVAPPSDGFSATMRTVTAARPDVIIAATPEHICAPLMKAISALAVRPKVVYGSTCLAPDGLSAAGAAAEDAFFESPTVPYDGAYDAATDADLGTFRRAMGKYAAAVPISVRTQVAFQSVMNIVEVVKKLGAQISPDRVAAELRQSKGRPNFMGHPYTCDGKQAPSLPAACDPHARVVQYRSGRLIEVTGAWLNPF